MNIIAHGLWGVALTPKKQSKEIKWSVFWSIFPDLPFLAVFIPYSLWSRLFVFLDWTDLPKIIFYIYGITHSLIIWGITAIVLLVLRKWHWPIIFWLFHILADIPGHTSFQTPLFFPVSEMTIRGIFSWDNYAISTLSHLVPLAIILYKFKITPK
jgi:hypothetical protein